MVKTSKASILCKLPDSLQLQLVSSTATLYVAGFTYFYFIAVDCFTQPCNMSNVFEEPEATPSANDPDLELEVQAAFVKQRPLYVNVLDDLGSSDYFVIDGDCLVLECLASPSIDLHHGGQMLHLTYLIEEFLDNLAACLNSCFRFVFFDRHAIIWSALEQDFFLLARRIVQQHLEFKLQQDVQYFPSWHSKAWHQYVKQVTLCSCMTESSVPQ